MSTKIISLAVLCAFMFCGCATVPQSPVAAAQANSEEDPYEGWLFNRVTGREQPAPTRNANNQSTQPTGGQDTSGVVQASAVQMLPPASDPSFSREYEKIGESIDDGEEDSGFDLSDLDPANIFKNIQAATGFGPDEALARQHLKDGEKLFKEATALHGRAEKILERERGAKLLLPAEEKKAALDMKAQAVEKFKEAEKSLKAAAGRWPDSLLEEDAMFLRAECLFFSDQYGSAQDHYDNLLNKYDNTRYLDTAVKRLFSIGLYWEGLHKDDPRWPVTPNLTDSTQPMFDTFGNALKAYESVRLKDPTGPLADDSIMATATAYYKKGRYEDAAYHYDLLREKYPKSEHQEKAHVLGLDSKMHVYQGAQYDRTPLDEAKEIADQALLQFPRKLGPSKAGIEQARARIVAEMASRDMAMAQYYDNRKCYGAASFYYKNIIAEYPNTPHAQTAAARMEEIKDKPAEPPNRFKWLTNIFPDG